MLESLSVATRLLAHIFAAPQIVADRLVSGRRDIHPLAVAVTEQPSDRHRVAAVSLDSISGGAGNRRRGDDNTLHPYLLDRPLQVVPMQPAS